MEAIPNADRATIAPAKIGSYLLNAGHEEGGPKATFFIAFGFTPTQPDALASALLRHALNPARVAQRPAGVVYVVEAPLETPSGRRPHVRSVWKIDTGDAAPRFVTAYPMEPPP